MTLARVDIVASEQVVESDGYRWIVRERTDDGIGPLDHEGPLWPAILALTPPGGVLVDVGAHVGHYVVRLAGRCQRVVAVEANPDAAAGLRRNLDLNGITNVDVHEQAAYDSDSTLTLWDPYGHVAGATTRTLPAGSDASLPSNYRADSADPAPVEPPASEIIGVPLDALDLAVPRIDVVKIDVEGAEAHVLRGFRDTLSRHHPALWIELHHEMYGQDIWVETTAELESSGYSWEVAARWCESTYLRAVRP